MRTVGGNLGVSFVVSGRVMLQGDSIEISAELTKVRDNTEIWGHRYRGKRANVISLQRQIAGDIAGELRSTLSPEDRQQVTNQGTTDAKAYSLYLKGRYAWNKRTRQTSKRPSPISIKPSPRTPNTLRPIRVSPTPMHACLSLAAIPAKTIRNRMQQPARPWSWTQPWLIPMPFWAATKWATTGILPEARPSLRRQSNSTPTMPRPPVVRRIATLGGREQEALAEINRAHQLDPLSPSSPGDWKYSGLRTAVRRGDFRLQGVGA